MKNQPPSPLRCAVYTRKSTLKGLEQQYNSLEAQEDKCKSFISLHEAHGWQHVRTFSDAGVSGGTTQRPALQAMLDAARCRQFDMVVVFKLDRLARNQRDFLNLLDSLSRHGVEVASATEPFDSASYLGRAMRNLLGVFAEMEREMISERTREKAEASRRKGLFLLGKPPFGYRRKDSRLFVEQEEARVVRLIFSRYQQLGSCHEVASSLTRDGILRPKRDGSLKPWSRKEIQRTLRNALYAGFVPSGSALYPGQHKAVIEPGVWEDVQRRLDSSGSLMQQRIGKKKHRFPYPLAGLLRCAGCGCPMVGSYACKGDKIYRYYSCPTRRQDGADACACPHLNADEAEKFICAQLSLLRNNPDFVAAVISRMPDASGGHVSDCLFHIDKLLSYASPDEMERIFKSVFASISFDWQHDKLDFKYQTLS